MNDIKAMTRKCTYCMRDMEVVGISVRTIPGYKNHVTGKDTAMVEKLSCGHELVDGKFNVDNLYFTAPAAKPIEDLTRSVEKLNQTVARPLRIEYVPVRRSSGGINVMDILCCVCLVALSFTCPPLVVLPILYFIARTK